jgi:heterodisulfide reductase subunit B
MRIIFVLIIALSLFVAQAQQKTDNLDIQWCDYSNKSSGYTPIKTFHQWVEKNCDVKVIDVTGKPLKVIKLVVTYGAYMTDLIDYEETGNKLSEKTKSVLMKAKGRDVVYIDAYTEDGKKAKLALGLK